MHKMESVKHKNKRGFSLIEVLVALAVLTIGLTALLITHGNSVRNTVAVVVIYRATTLAQEKMAELEMNNYELEDPEELELEAGDYYYSKLYEEGEFENESFDRLLDWREDYLWEISIEETDLEGIGKLVVNVYNEVFRERIQSVEVVTWIPCQGFIEEEDESQFLP